MATGPQACPLVVQLASETAPWIPTTLALVLSGVAIDNETGIGAAAAALDFPVVSGNVSLYNETDGEEGAFVVATNSSWGIDNAPASEAPLWCAMYDTLGQYGILSAGATTNTNTDVDFEGDLPTSCPSEYLLSVTNMNHNDEKEEAAVS